VYGDANVGEGIAVEQGTVVLTGGDAGNYELVWTDGVGSITPAALTVRVNDDAKFVTRGDVPGYAGVSYSGFVNGETVGVVDQSGLTIVRTNTGTEQAGVYADVLAASGLSAANYEVLYEAGDYTIVAADALWLQLSGGDQVYGDAAVYGLQRASYLDSGSNEVVDLTGSATLTGDVVSVDDGSGGVVTVSLEALSSSQSGAGERPVGVYGVQAGAVTGESSNFGGQVTVTGTLTVRPRMLTAAVTGGREKV